MTHQEDSAALNDLTALIIEHGLQLSYGGRRTDFTSI